MLVPDEPLLRISRRRALHRGVRAKAGRAPDGYLTYRLAPGPLREQPVRELVIEDLITIERPGPARAWQFCCGFSQAAEVTAWNLPADEPLAWLVPESQRPAITGLRPFLRLRLLDVAAALAARCYRRAGDLVLEISDPVLAGKDRRYLLRGRARRRAVPRGRPVGRSWPCLCGRSRGRVPGPDLVHRAGQGGPGG